ncbi:hypothetical protein SASPL_130891 [Salvia splendens]|uniref:Uncharacterized protein n=1 Tax=Salvia splendens TaxID=180675 RepID=A0A8X8ZKC9_SALSN|nr:hypothetical protein SASPL_130891 [Salvia splendens]
MGEDEAYGVCWQSLAKELETGGYERDQWLVARLLEASVMSNGLIRSASEAAGERERVLCMKRLLVVQGHYLSREGCSLSSLG